MKGILTSIMALALVTAAIQVVADEAAETKEAAAPAAAPKACFVCEKCGCLSMTTGKCATCQAELKASHIVAIKDGFAYCCDCGAACKCTPKGDDLTMCSCGKPLVKVSLKGKYVCECGAACKCNPVSDVPGKCSCGKDMKKVE